MRPTSNPFPDAVAPAPAGRFTVVVPALNEERGLGPTVEAILRAFGAAAFDVEVLVFDDASTDRTGAIADEWAARDRRVRAFHNGHRLNIGGIYRAGIRLATGEHLLLVPGDNEMRVDELVRGARRAHEAPVVVFHVTNAWAARPPLRALISRLYVLAVNVLFNTRFRYTNGTNIFRTDVLRGVPILTDGFSYQTEALVKAVRAGADYIEVGIRIQPRRGGRSKALSWRNLRLVAGALGRLWLDVMVRERGRYGCPGRRIATYRG
ncbi:MAG: glycosyltransferase family 2 protein [Candidatus Rokubacteria bacterium]|nr:glycosyltransferase family 2 protein [Candidatus Rokubacteria bacterium]